MNSVLLYRWLTALLFFAAFLAHTFSRAFVMADYYVNTGKYANNCENKATPAMHCNGKCQMTKQLQQEEKRDQENPGRKAENKHENVLSSKSFFAVLNAALTPIVDTNLFAQAADSYTYNCPGSIFHPPKM